MFTISLFLQEGFYSLDLMGNDVAQNYALFGPYNNLCITAPSSCSTGFTFAMWIKKDKSKCSNSSHGIMSTRAKIPSNTEGIWLRCSSSIDELEYGLFVEPERYVIKEIFIPSADVWVHSTMVWNVGGYLKIYHKWASGSASGLSSLSTSNSEHHSAENTVRELVFGMAFTDDISWYGSGMIDGVKVFNRPLTQSEVEALYANA